MCCQVHVLQEHWNLFSPGVDKSEWKLQDCRVHKYPRKAPCKQGSSKHRGRKQMSHLATSVKSGGQSKTALFASSVPVEWRGRSTCDSYCFTSVGTVKPWVLLHHELIICYLFMCTCARGLCFVLGSASELFHSATFALPMKRNRAIFL